MYFRHASSNQLGFYILQNCEPSSRQGETKNSVHGLKMLNMQAVLFLCIYLVGLVM